MKIRWVLGSNLERRERKILERDTFLVSWKRLVSSFQTRLKLNTTCSFIFGCLKLESTCSFILDSFEPVNNLLLHY